MSQGNGRRSSGALVGLAAVITLLAGLPLGMPAVATESPASEATTRGAGGPSAAGCPEGYMPTTVVRGAQLCAHGTLDIVEPNASEPRLDAGARATAMAPHCYGDGTSGNRIELLYVVADNAPDRSGVLGPIILGQYVPAIEALVRTTSKQQGREIGLRLHAPGCTLSLQVVKLPPAVLAPEPDVFEQTGRIVDALAEAGFDHSDRKYLVWIDGLPATDSRPGSPFNNIGPCGVATGAVMDSGGIPNPMDQPTATNYHDGLVPMYALIFSRPATFYAGTPCWGAGTTGADVEAHELFHALGAVQLSAPNSNGLAHCTDGPDLMCYPEFGQKVENRCFRSTVKLLDCNGDDYFHADPPEDSYLMTHWNTANSSFLGDSLLDSLPIEVRRP